MRQVLRLAGGRDIVLFHPSDGLRGAAGFYRNKTALEYQTPEELMRRLGKDPGGAVLLMFRDRGKRHFPLMLKAAREACLALHVETSVDFGVEDRPLLIITTERLKQEKTPSGYAVGDKPPPS